MNYSGKEGHRNIQCSIRPGIEPEILGLGGRDLHHCANPSAVRVMGTGHLQLGGKTVEGASTTY